MDTLSGLCNYVQEVFLRQNAWEARSYFILVNFGLILINFLVIIMVGVSLVRFHKNAKRIDVLRVTRLKELECALEQQSFAFTHMTDLLSNIEKAIQVCHQLHLKK